MYDGWDGNQGKGPLRSRSEETVRTDDMGNEQRKKEKEKKKHQHVQHLPTNIFPASTPFPLSLSNFFFLPLNQAILPTA